MENTVYLIISQAPLPNYGPTESSISPPLSDDKSFIPQPISRIAQSIFARGFAHFLGRHDGAGVPDSTHPIADSTNQTTRKPRTTNQLEPCIDTGPAARVQRLAHKKELAPPPTRAHYQPTDRLRTEPAHRGIGI